MAVSKLLTHVVCALAAAPSLAGEFAFGEIQGRAELQGDAYVLSANAPLWQARVPATAQLLILADGLYAQAEDGELALLIATNGAQDTPWQALNDRIENATVEPEVEGDLALAYQLAFRAELDGNPDRVTEKLAATGLQVRAAREGSWTFNPENADHMTRAKAAMRRLGQGIAAQDLRVAGTARTLLLGFPSAKGDAALFWPLKQEARLALAPPQTADAYAELRIGARILLPAARWFEPVALSEGEVALCVPLRGCGYLASEAVQPVQPLWIAFDRESLEPVALYLD